MESGCKQRKLQSHSCVDTDYTNETCTLKKKNSMVFLPTAVLKKIFGFLTYTDLAEVMRYVSKKFKAVAEEILNAYFKHLEHFLDFYRKDVMKMIAAAENSHNECKVGNWKGLLSILESIEFYHSAITATVWRYVYGDGEQFGDQCFYGGKILDCFGKLIRYCALYPEEKQNLYANLNYLGVLTKLFCDHFDKTIEEPLNNSFFVSGTKLLDILDTAKFSKKNVHYKKLNGVFYKSKVNYYFENSWMVSFGMSSNERTLSYNEEQKNLFSSLRKFVFKHTEMNFRKNRQIVSNSLQQKRVVSKKIYESTGYSEIGDKILFYGVRSDKGGQKKDLFGAPFEVNGVCIKVETICPMSLAPYEFLKKRLIRGGQNLRRKLDQCKFLPEKYTFSIDIVN